MPTRNVVLTQHHEDLIADLVATGRYQNASEVLREGLRLVETRDAEDAARLVALKAEAQVGIDSIARGDYREFISVDAAATYLNDLADRAILKTSQP